MTPPSYSIRKAHGPIGMLAAAIALPSYAAGQTLTEINDETLFVNQTGSTAQPALSTQVGGVVGDLTFTTPAGSSLSFNEFTALIPTTPDLAISGVENLNIALAAPIFSLGFQFVDPTDAPNSTFDITLFSGGAGGSVVNTFNFESPKDVLHFGGFVSDTAFDYVEIREIGGDSGNELFGQFYTGASAGRFWTLPSSGTWDGGGSWSGGAVPGASDDVFITDEITKTITGPASATTINSLTIDNQDLTNSGGAGTTTVNLSTGDLTVTDGFVIGSTATDSGTSILNLGGSTLNVGGDTTILAGGSLVEQAGTFNPTGAVNLAGGTLSLDSIGSVTPNWTSGKLQITGNSGLSVSLNGSLGPNPISIDANKTLEVIKDLTINPSVIFDVDGGTVIAENLTAFLGTINADSGTVNVASTFLNQGTVNLAGADVNVHTFDASAVAPNFTGGKLTIHGGSYIPFAGVPDFSLDGASGGPTFELINGGTANITGDISVAPTNDAGLSVLSGSSLSMGGDLLIGQTKGDSDSTTTFSGVGTTVDVSGNFLMGTGSTSGDTARNLLVVEDGAALTVDGDTTLGSNARVELTGGSITTDSWARLGFSQFAHNGGTLNIDGGVFSSGTSNYILGGVDRPVVNLTNGASQAGGTNSNADINNGELHVLSGSSLNLTTGIASLQVFNNTGSGDPALLEIDGPGSSVTVGGLVDIGRNNNGHGTLNITNGGSLTTTGTGGTVAIGVNDNTIGIATVDGVGSNITVSGTAGLFVGNEGVGTLDITSGASVDTTILTVADSDINNANTGTSILTVNGTDGGGTIPSTLNATGISYIGGSTNEDRGTGILNIQAGALFNSNGGVIGSGDGSGPDGTGTVNVTGTDSFWNSVANGSSDILVGDTGAGTLNVTAGGRVDADAVFIGDNSGSETAAMTIDGGSSVVNVRGTFVVGNNRRGTLELTNGATLNTSTISNGGFLIGNSTSADNSSVLVDNSTIVHNGTGRVSVGDDSNGTPSSMTLQNGGSFTSAGSWFFVGDVGGSTGNLVVDGEGSLLSVGPRIAIGDNGVGTMTVSNGGDVVVTDAGSYFEVGAATAGNGVLTVTDPGSTVTVGNYLSVGDESNANGTLNIVNGGTVTTGGHAYIARQGYLTSTGVLNVQDLNTGDGSSGSTLNVGGNLYLSGNASGGGGDATLNVNAGGTVNITGLLKLWDDGKVNLNGGTINVATFDLEDPLEAPTPDFTFTSGTFRYTAGATLNSEALDDLLGPGVPTLTANKNLVVTDEAVLNTPVRLNGGSLSVGSVFNNDSSMLDFDTGTFNLTTADLTVGTGGTGGLFGDVMTVNLGQTVNVTNLVTVDASAELTIIGEFSSGGLTNNGDLVIIDTTGGGKTINGPVSNPTSSAVTLVGDITFADAVNGGGGFFGPGTPNFAGGFSPGDSPGTVTFESGLTLTDANTLFIELGGNNPGEFDRLEADGFASIDGTLDVSLINGYTPNAGDSFGFLFANAGFGGSFDTLNLPDISGLGLDWQLNPGGSTLFLDVVATLQGDLNGDGFVGVDDLNIVLINWNQNVTPGDLASGDPTGEGFVGVDDLNIVLVNWNSGTPPGGSSSNIPEPTSAVLVSVGAVAMFKRRR